MRVTTEQWLDLHKRALDTIRAAIRDLDEEKLLRRIPPMMRDSIASEIAHICNAEAYWLREVHIEPLFSTPSEAKWSVEAFLDVIDRIEERYPKILSEKPNDPNILFGLGRVCQHALYHLVRIRHFRIVQEPNWSPPKQGSWENVVDFISDRLILD